MRHLKVKVTEDNKDFIEQLLSKLGCEIEGGKQEQTGNSIDETVSPTLLFGKWKALDIDTKNFRKKLWERKS